jgi:hypothetical protein
MGGRDRFRTCGLCRVKSASDSGAVGGGQEQTVNDQVSGPTAGGHSPIATQTCPMGCWETAGTSEASKAEQGSGNVRLRSRLRHRSGRAGSIVGSTDAVGRLSAFRCVTCADAGPFGSTYSMYIPAKAEPRWYTSTAASACEGFSLPGRAGSALRETATAQLKTLIGGPPLPHRPCRGPASCCQAAAKDPLRLALPPARFLARSQLLTRTERAPLRWMQPGPGVRELRAGSRLRRPGRRDPRAGLDPHACGDGMVNAAQVAYDNGLPSRVWGRPDPRCRETLIPVVERHRGWG